MGVAVNTVVVPVTSNSMLIISNYALQVPNIKGFSFLITSVIAVLDLLVANSWIFMIEESVSSVTSGI